MRGRGIGTARGRATIMRGTYLIFSFGLNIDCFLAVRLVLFLTANGMVFFISVRVVCVIILFLKPCSPTRTWCSSPAKGDQAVTNFAMAVVDILFVDSSIYLKNRKIVLPWPSDQLCVRFTHL